MFILIVLANDYPIVVMVATWLAPCSNQKSN